VFVLIQVGVRLATIIATMKFVIRSLLFVNLLLQMTNSLRQCFNHDQNIMITIILLAFSVIGLIGLVIGNRFILIIFSASMTLILIASITIYAIGRTDEDTLKPKVPYYTTRQAYQETIEKRLRSSTNDDRKDHRFRSLIDRWLTTNNSKNSKEEPMRNKNRQRSNSKLRNNTVSVPAVTQYRSDPAKSVVGKKVASFVRQPNIQTTTRLSALTFDELSDESTPDLNTGEPSSLDARIPTTAAANQQQSNTPNLLTKDTGQKLTLSPIGKRLQSPIDNEPDQDSDEDDLLNSDDKVESEQWVAYERYLYEQYLNIVSQSIDLVMHTILAAWMALLLDEDSDQCFGPRTQPSSSMVGIGRTSSKAPPVYNYNGVRYSIRPDVDDSFARVVVN
jgi:hypothetical protein